ncbi:MAG TPA: hypothetical protein VGT02_12995 [Methylomirabilota bacterium]|jgi:hypothetical protein|nr:hypothetical protein [Methylomirabilota bacterium]
MALTIWGKSPCALCGVVLEAGDDLVGTPHFIADQADPWWEYSDASMHRRCFLVWEHRQAFVAKYNATIGQRVWGNGTRHRMELDGTIVVEPGPFAPENAPPAVREYLARLGTEAMPVCWWRIERPRDPHQALWVITFTPRSGMFTVVSMPTIVSHWTHQLDGGGYDAAGMEQQVRDGLWGAPEAARTAVLTMLHH